MTKKIESSETDDNSKEVSMSITTETCLEEKFSKSSPSTKRNIARPRDLPNLTGLSRTTIWRLERAGDFPKKIKLSAGAVGYFRHELDEWLESRQTGVEEG
jgi:prophage regulatory protein